MVDGFKKRVGSKAEVWHGTAKYCPGGTTRAGLMKTRHGRIVTKKQHSAGKKAYARLVKAGYKPTKGKFTLMRKSMRGKSSRRSTRKRGGFAGLAGVPNFASVSNPGK